jgi:hypothetical protein
MSIVVLNAFCANLVIDAVDVEESLYSANNL